VRPPRRFSVLACVLACAEAPEPSAPEGPADACPLEGPVRLVAPEPGWERDPQSLNYSFSRVGERLLYSFDAITGVEARYWLIDRCGGEPELLAALPTTIFALEAFALAAGPTIYARDLAGGRHLVDRLERAGIDGPIAVPGLPVAEYHVTAVGGRALFLGRDDPTRDLSAAAAVGAGTQSVYSHDGDPGHGVLTLGLKVVRAAARGDRELLLDDLGVLREVDVSTGAATELLAGVRSFSLSPDDRYLVWQAIGDDVAEPVYLRDLEGGGERPLAVNDFAAASWGRDPESPRAGWWLWTDDSGVALQVGPGEVLVGAYLSTTGEALPVPEHTDFGPWWERDLGLVREAGGEREELVWDPRSGATQTWYRGPAGVDPAPRRVADDTLEYFVPERVDAGKGSLWRVDLASGEPRNLLPWVNRNYVRVDEARYLVRRHDLALGDAETQVYRTLAGSVDDWEYVPDQGVIWLDSEGPEPGLWAAPIP